MDISQDLRNLEMRALELDNTVLDIVSHGVYHHTKRRTKVAAVAVYQNDGTATITPSHFVERAAQKAKFWEIDIAEAVVDAIDGSMLEMHRLGEKASRDINDMCDRIDTRRLKHSFHHLLKKV